MPRHIGIVACSAEGAALCYRTICAEGARLLGPHAHPDVSLHTHSLAAYVECLNRGDWQGVGELMLASANKLATIGADFLICPDNTIHQAPSLFEEMALGVTPVGVALDFAETKEAIQAGDVTGAVLGLVGFVPALGDALKAGGRYLREGLETMTALTPADVKHIYELGVDPVKGYNRLEGIAGAQLEARIGRRVERDPSGNADFFDGVGLGYISALGPVPSNAFDASSFQKALIRHVNQDVDHVAVSISGLTTSQKDSVVKAMSSLSEGQLRKVIVTGE